MTADGNSKHRGVVRQRDELAARVRELEEGKMTKKFEQWAVVEIMGRQSVSGRCSEETIAGAVMLRVDIPNGENFITRYFGSSAIYSISVTGEAEARSMAESNRDQRPPFAYQVERSLLPRPTSADDDGDPMFREVDE